jgi:hypothetical protein
MCPSSFIGAIPAVLFIFFLPIPLWIIAIGVFL